MANPSKTDWAKLYHVSLKFKEMAPWTWIGNEDQFAVENPVSKEVGYCSILGIGGEQFGLGIFLGDDGYQRYLRLVSDEPVSDDFTETIMTPMLSLLFADRADLQKEDIDVIHSLGLQFRGNNAWPLFRSQKPGYAPWFLTKEDAVFLTCAIEQSLVVAGRVRNDKLDLYEGADDDLLLTRYNRDGEWEEDWCKAPLPLRITSGTVVAADILRGVEIIKAHIPPRRISGNWELDIFIVPVPIGPKSGKPRFPLCFLVVEGKRGVVTSTHMSEPWINLFQKQKVVLQILENADVLPRSINVKSKQVKDILEPVVKGLGISIRLTTVPMLDQFKLSLTDHLHDLGSGHIMPAG